MKKISRTEIRKRLQFVLDWWPLELLQPRYPELGVGVEHPGCAFQIALETDAVYYADYAKMCDISEAGAFCIGYAIAKQDKAALAKAITAL